MIKLLLKKRCAYQESIQLNCHPCENGGNTKEMYPCTESRLFYQGIDMKIMSTVKILNIGTCMSEQTV